MTNAAYDVVGIGNAIVDILAKVDDSVLNDLKLAKGSMSLVDQEQSQAIFDLLKDPVKASGGSAANTIAGIASFGGSSAFIGKVADDEAGTAFRRDIEKIGVTFETPALKNGNPSAKCMVLVTPDGERTMNTYLGASIELSRNDISEDLISKSAICYLEGYLWDPPQAKEAFKIAAAAAKKNERKVSLTLSDSFCVERHRDSFLELIKDDIDILFANEEEIKTLFQTEDFDTAALKIADVCGHVALTRSEKGSVVILDGVAESFPAEPVEKVIDATGAGDMFAAGFLTGVSRKLAPAACARLGAIAAAEVISHVGARPLVNLAELAREKGAL